MRRTSSRLARACGWATLVVVAAAFALVALGVATDRWRVVATDDGRAALTVPTRAEAVAPGEIALLRDDIGRAEFRALRITEQLEGRVLVPRLLVPHAGRIISGAASGIGFAIMLAGAAGLGWYAITGGRRRGRAPFVVTTMIVTLAVASPALAAFTVPSGSRPVMFNVPYGGTLTPPSGVTSAWTGVSALDVNWTTPVPVWAQGQQLQRKAYPGAWADYGSLLSPTATTTNDSSATTPSATKYTYRLYGTAYLWTGSYSAEVTSNQCTGTITTVARPPLSLASGPDGLFYWEDSNGSPWLYIADTGNHVVRKVDLTTGVISRVAGTGAAGFDEPCSPASNCKLNQPESVYVKSNGDVLIADSASHRIRKVTAAGAVSTIAGTGTPGFTGDGGAATAAKLDRPVGITMVGSDIYITDRNNNKLRKFTEGGNISTVAGAGGSFADGDCGAAVGNCLLNAPELISSDASGNIYIADRQNNRVRVYSTSALTMSTLAGGGAAGFADGTALASNMDKPEAVWVMANGDVYVADRDNNRIRKISVAPNPDTISTVAGVGTVPEIGDGFAATASAISGPRGVTASPSGQVYYSDTGHNGVRRITTAGNQETVIGLTAAGLAGEGLTAFTWRHNTPRRMAVDSSGNVYYADHASNMVRKYTASTGDVSIVAGNGTGGSSGDGGQATAARLNNPQGVALDAAGANLYIADTDNHKIRKVIIATGVISSYAGTGTSGYTGEGTATSFRLNSPTDVAVDSSGNLYIADSANHRIRKVTTGSVMSTYAGNGTSGSGGDGGAATSANLNTPGGVAMASNNDLYIADTTNHKIRTVSVATGNISTFAGTGSAGFSGDSGAPGSAALSSPADVFVNGSTVYITDRANQRVRKVVSNVISTVLGTGTASSTGDGGRYNEATVLNPFGLAVDPSGNFFVSEDSSSGSVRRVAGGL